MKDSQIMTYQILNTTVTASFHAVDLGVGEGLLIGRNGVAAVTSASSAVNGVGSNHWVRIEGTAFGYVGVALGDNSITSHTEHLLLTSTGVVSGQSIGVFLAAQECTVGNFGLIEGIDGINFAGNGDGVSRLYNAGMILGEAYGVISSSAEALVIRNSGVIMGDYASILTSNLNDTLRNSGQLIGNVRLGDGQDSYDGRGGTVEGTIYGEAGEDKFRVGAASETIDGGDGTDVLDFRLAGAVHVALDGSIANTGVASGDEYNNIEDVLGSRFGADLLVGSAVSNTLDGFGGQDTLSGGMGNDYLTGGLGADRLIGGAGNDRFIFNTTAECGDTVTDFHNSTGNNDAFIVSAAGFGGGLVAGALADTQFLVRADNLAQDGDDRFIFNTATHKLWFDVNGNAAGGLTLVATIEAGVMLSASDILLTF